MPCNAYFLGWLFLETSYERLGLLLLGSSPGGANSNFWVWYYQRDYVTLAQQMFYQNKTKSLITGSLLKTSFEQLGLLLLDILYGGLK